MRRTPPPHRHAGASRPERPPPSGSQRALKTVEAFTESAQRAADFDSDPNAGPTSGVNILDRCSQVHFKSELQALCDFPPAPRATVFGKVDSKLATESELRGEAVFFGNRTGRKWI